MNIRVHDNLFSYLPSRIFVIALIFIRYRDNE